MARVALLCPDLLFGSKVEGGLRAAGHEVTRYDDPDTAGAGAAGADALFVDLTAEGIDPAAVVGSLRSAGGSGVARTVGFYPHVDQGTRRRAEAAGFDLVLPRSRMAREPAAVLDRALAR